MSEKSKVVSLAAAFKARGASDILLPKPLQNIKQIGCKHLVLMLRSLFENADDSFFDMADKADTNSEQNVYFEAMRDLRIKRSALEKHFHRQVVDGFSHLMKQGDAEGPFGSVPLEGLSLLQRDELEQAVAIEGMVARVVNRDQGMQLAHLTTRIDLLVSHTVTQSNNPFGPKLLSEAFAAACQSLDINIQVKLIVFKIFEKHVLDKIDQLYVNVNRALVADGVLSELVPPSRQAASADASSHTPAGPAGQKAQQPDGAPSEDQLTRQVFGVLQKLLAQSGIADAATLTAVDSAQPVASQQDFLLFLSRLQEKMTELHQLPVSEADDVRQAVSGLMDNQKNTSLSSTDDDAINLVSMLFEFIIGDRDLPEKIKELLGRLQIPILKVAIIDKAFFVKGSHPARRLLNEMASAALESSGQDELAKDRLYQQLETVVYRVLREFDDDVSVFEACLDDLLNFLTKERRRSELMEQRARDVEEGREKAQTADNVVRAVLGEKMAGQRLPVVVINLLQDAWSQVLRLIFLKEGDHSKKWQESLELVDRLIWSVRSIANSDEREQLLQTAPGLLKQLRAGLVDIAYDFFAMDSLLDGLERVHLSRLRPGQGTGEDSPDLEVIAIPGDEASESDVIPPYVPISMSEQGTLQNGIADASSNQDVATASLEESGQAGSVGGEGHKGGGDIVDRVVEPPEDGVGSEQVLVKELTEDDPSYRLIDNLKVGAWVEFIESADKGVRCKLAAVIKAQGRYVFVNRTGVKVTEKTRQELAVELRSGEMRLLDDALLFDRALESVIGNLRDMKKSRH